MIVRSVGEVREIVGTSRHGGTGDLHQRRMFESPELVSHMSIVAWDVLPPGVAIGVHPHPTEEEIYVILEGSGTMTVDGEDRVVTAGDMILTQPGSSHGLRNHTHENLTMLAVEVKMP